MLLTHKAGLRACEAARMRVANLTDANGNPASTVFVPGSVAKGRRERTVPMHHLIREALIAFQRKHPNAKFVALARWSGTRPRPTSVNALTTWFHRIYKEVGFRGVSSHSGRRSFGTAAARKCYETGNTLVEVQHLLGHSMLSTTAAYVESSQNVRNLIDAI